MKKSPKCYACIYCQTCDKENELKCESRDYILFTTEEEKQLCDLMGCNNIEVDNEENE